MTKNRNKQDLHILAIGASAGGLEAIHDLFDVIPAGRDIAFVLIQHLSSDYKSLLVELVSKHTHMQVVEATNGVLLKSSCVYVIPNDRFITIKNGRLKLESKNDKAPNNAIDHFLKSLALDARDRAMAIILSGTGSDGTMGAAAIKEQGGMVMAQEPTTAKFDSMPVNVIKSGNVDYVLPVKSMYEKLEEHVSMAPIRAIEQGLIEDSHIDRIFELVHSRTDRDYSLYKTPTIFRRIGRRMKALELSDINSYIEVLESSDHEINLLDQDFLINVTRFFRDKQAFNILRDEVIPDIVAKKDDDDILKVWVCACSTGEEAYSVAIMIDDHLQKVGKSLDVKIYASDVDEKSLEIASKNSFPISVKKDIPATLFKKYFLVDDQRVSVIPSIRKQIVFARHNVIKMPPFIKNDLICCRNMLIYMSSILQREILTNFHFCLNPDSYLFLGPSETIAPIKDGVTEINAKWKIFKKTGTVDRLTTFADNNRRSLQRPIGSRTPKKAKKSSEEHLQSFIMETYNFVGVFVDRNFEIKDTVGDYKKFLFLPDKKLEMNILKMVPKEISYLLNNLVRSAWKDEQNKSLKKLKIKTKQVDQVINIDVRPANAELDQAYTLIVFREIEVGQEVSSYQQSQFSPEDQHANYVMELEGELSEVRNNLQVAIEEMDTTNEELQSSNEELLSANEELQSSNEELQSLNEELHTLNAEHQQKIKELIELNDDLDNYFKSVDIGQIFLDHSGKIRKFNPVASRIVNIIHSDIGRPIAHISNNINDNEFLHSVNRALESDGPVPEKEVTLKDGHVFLLRIIPYVRIDGKKDGVVITFVDITAINKLNNSLVGVFKTSLSAVIIFTPLRDANKKLVDFKCYAANKTVETIVGIPSQEIPGKLFSRHLDKLYNKGLFDELVNIVGTEKRLELEIQLENGYWYIVTATNIGDLVAVNYTDITERKKAEQNLRKNYNELLTARESLKSLNNELETRVRERTMSLVKSEDRFKLVSRATNDTIWDWNLVDNSIWRSENFNSMFGYAHNETSQTTDFWYEHIHKDDVDSVKTGVYDAINKQKKTWSAEYRFLRADGTYVEVLDRGSLQYDNHGVPFRMVGSVVDVSAVKTAERRRQELQDFILRQQKEFYELFANAPALISIRRGEDLVYDYTNAAFKDFYSTQNMIGLSSADAHKHVVDSSLYKNDQDILRSGKSFSGKAFPVVKFDKEGNEVGKAWIDFIFTPVFNDRKEIEGIAFFGFEVTQLVLSQLATKDLMNRKDEFMSVASHELKTPITSLKGMLQISLRSLEANRPVDILRDFILKSLRQTDKLTYLINDLLDVTRIHAGKMQLNHSSFNLEDVAKEIIDDFQNNEIQHRIDFISTGSVQVVADKHRLEQVIMNFLSNAVKYSPGGERVIVRLEKTMDGFIKFSVQDFGIGIPTAKKEFVFDRFFRVEDSIKFAGLGLGLFICKDIIERHEGLIGVDSVEGDGSTFWFKIPLT